MPDTAALKIINIKDDSIQAVKEECNTNIGNAKESTQHRKCMWCRRAAQIWMLIQKVITMSTAIMITLM